MSPKVSVVMPVYNAENFLRPAIDSILNQTFDDIDFIIVDDASSDLSPRILREYNDPRIRYIHNLNNQGIARSLNQGLELAVGEYVARMDSDDISLPERIEHQVSFMEKHPEVIACGTWAINIDCYGHICGKYHTPIKEDIDHFYWRPSPLIHPSAMFRQRAGFRYDESFAQAQDYDLWLRMRMYGRLANLPEEHLLYRVHSHSVTGAKRESQLRTSYKVFRKHTRAEKLTYDAFLSLLHCSYRLNPVQRIIAAHYLMKVLCLPDFVFARDNVLYTKRWIMHKLPKRYPVD